MAEQANLNFHGARCPCCQKPLSGTAVAVCRHCNAPYHSACAAYLGTCATYGCLGTSFNYIGVAKGEVTVPKGDEQWEKPEEPTDIRPLEPVQRGATPEQISRLPDFQVPMDRFSRVMLIPLLVFIALGIKIYFHAQPGSSSHSRQSGTVIPESPPEIPRPLNARNCPDCKSTGIASTNPSKPPQQESRYLHRIINCCPKCNGVGFVNSDGTPVTPCFLCLGSRKSGDLVCPACRPRR